ncbi:GDP-mannose 4,6-dehydratase [Deltaproteobacteria bacterium OttesenSCG-928-K17]|nr:GDP-mannose 4,6-dehydratase [Deltaproteobacteria bacterium OttesenSCG-928-K17]
MGAILITGGAGFIGSHAAEALSGLGRDVIILDNFNDYYDPALKRDNIKSLMAQARRPGLYQADLTNVDELRGVFKENNISAVIHLAALAGVRPSLERPAEYMRNNVLGTINLLEYMRQFAVKQIVFASSSSVYGGSGRVPFREDDPADQPLCPYAVTKRDGELLMYNYHHLYGFKAACLRFFTVYGPRQRPDLAISKFTGLLLNHKPIVIRGDGRSSRDYTHISDILTGLTAALKWVEDVPADGGYEIFNLGSDRTVPLMDLVRILEEVAGRKALMEFAPLGAGEVDSTWADLEKSGRVLGYKPKVDIKDGLADFVQWYKENRRG